MEGQAGSGGVVVLGEHSVLGSPTNQDNNCK